MAANHYVTPTLPLEKVRAVRLGAGTGSANNMSDVDSGKMVKLVAESRYDLCAAGDKIEGLIVAVENATSGGYSVGGIVNEGEVYATADGLQATPGTGTIAIGDYVVAGTATAKGTALTAYPKVCKATSQTFGAFTWRVESLGTAGTGAVGTTICLSRVDG